jgi:hypothetical protein
VSEEWPNVRAKTPRFFEDAQLDAEAAQLTAIDPAGIEDAQLNKQKRRDSSKARNSTTERRVARPPGLQLATVAS